MIVHLRWTIIKKQHPSKTCRFHGMQFFNGPVGAIKKHFELAKLCFAFEQFFEPSLFDTPYNKWYCK